MEKIPVKIVGDSMWPNFHDGQIVDFEKYNGQTIHVGNIIVFPNPNNTNILLVKRVSKIVQKMYFVVGDNPDPTSSTDSHNFGTIDDSTILAFRQNHIAE